LKGYHPDPYFPLGIGYIAAVLERAGHDVKIWNADVTTGITSGVMPDEVTMLGERQQRYEMYMAALANPKHAVWLEMQEILESFDPEIVGLSVLTPEVGAAHKLSTLIKEEKRDRTVIWGGHHVTFLPDDVLGYGPVDVVVRGEGENTMLELVSAIAGGRGGWSAIAGISYKEGSVIRHNPDRELIKDLDSLPFPAHHLSLFPDAYKRMERIGMMTNRGCPFRCGYCSSPAFTKKTVRFRSFNNVLEEIRYITSYYNKNIVSMLDDNFTINKKNVIDLCEHLIDADIKVSWDTMTRADILTEDVVMLLKRAGCCGIAIGIESGSERVLEMIKKGVRLDKVVDAYELLYRYDIPSGANFIIGFPEETREDIMKTFEVMKKIKTVNINFNIFEPIPGSPLLEDCNRMGLIPKDVDWREYGFWPMHHYVIAIPPDEFKELAFKIATWVFQYKSSFKVRWMRLKPYIKNDPLFIFKKILKSLRVRLMKRFMKG
jgi:radical SAM superfamily enzyme YgiQ (UPF0313 family)